ncbi:MAG: hypothetical protein K0S71_689 [Clostridia bacterium]|jgi:hypothetical protein|nr:hypothetical protein [Clostridia bacterium]
MATPTIAATTPIRIAFIRIAVIVIKWITSFHIDIVYTRNNQLTITNLGRKDSE